MTRNDLRAAQSNIGVLPTSLKIVPWCEIADMTLEEICESNWCSEAFTRRIMRSGLPGVALLDQTNQEVVAYEGIYPWGETGMTYTSTKWRGRRLHSHVTTALAGALFDRGCPILQAQVALKNTSALRCFRNVGWRDTGMLLKYIRCQPAE